MSAPINEREAAELYQTALKEMDAEFERVKEQVRYCGDGASLSLRQQIEKYEAARKKEQEVLKTWLETLDRADEEW